MTIEQVLEFKELESASGKKFDTVKVKALAFAKEIGGVKAAGMLPTIAKHTDAESLARSLRVFVKVVVPQQLRIEITNAAIIAAYTKAFDL